MYTVYHSGAVPVNVRLQIAIDLPHFAFSFFSKNLTKGPENR
jgi:hypothetical protein